MEGNSIYEIMQSYPLSRMQKTEAAELYNFITTDGEAYNQLWLPTVRILLKFKRRGNFSAARALRYIRKLVDVADKMYMNGLHLDQIHGYRVSLDKSVRDAVAAELLDLFEGEYEAGDLDFVKNPHRNPAWDELGPVPHPGRYYRVVWEPRRGGHEDLYRGNNRAMAMREYNQAVWASHRGVNPFGEPGVLTFEENTYPLASHRFD